MEKPPQKNTLLAGTLKYKIKTSSAEIEKIIATIDV